MNDLLNFSEDVYSQFGEDGIIKEILRRIAVKRELDRWCVEFGAWDGVHLSNTCRLIREDNYRAVLIECDKSRHADLLRNFPTAKVQALRSFISLEGSGSLDNTLSSTGIPFDFDFLSIDVDGVDFHVFDSMTIYCPKVICIEFNPSIPNAVDFVQKPDLRVKQGSSARAISRLAETKGYSLVACTDCNLLFVRSDLRDLVVDGRVTLEEINPLGNHPTYLFVGFDGTLLSNSAELNFFWHGFRIPTEKCQFLPKLLRRYRGDYGFGRRQLLKLWLSIMMPQKLCGKIRRRPNL